MRLVPERSLQSEILDRADNSPADLEAALGDIRLTNRWLGGRRTLLGALDPFLDPDGPPLEILDVGAGGADLPLEMVRRARRRGCAVRVTAIDRDPEIVRLARRAVASCPEVVIARADAWQPPFADRAFDLVTASMFLHHFSFDEIVRLLVGFRRMSRRAVLINDLRRHRLPWGFIYLVSRLTGRHPMYVHDAPLSVLRGFTADELRSVAGRAGAAGVTVRRRWPFRLEMTVPAAGEAA